MKNKIIIAAVLFISFLTIGSLLYFNKTEKVSDINGQKNVVQENTKDSNEDEDLDIKLDISTIEIDDERVDKLEFDEEDYVSNYEESLRDRNDENRPELPKMPEEAITNEGGEIKISISDGNNTTEKIIDKKTTTQ